MNNTPEALKNCPQWAADLYNYLPPVCTRSQVASTGLVTTGTLANMDSRGIGIPERIQIGNKVCYPRLQTVLWLVSRSNASRGGNSVENAR